VEKCQRALHGEASKGCPKTKKRERSPAVEAQFSTGEVYRERIYPVKQNFELGWGSERLECFGRRRGQRKAAPRFAKDKIAKGWATQTLRNLRLRHPPDGYLLGSYRIATAPEANSSRLTSFKLTGFDSPANNVGPCPVSLGCTTNSYSSINPSSANASGSCAKKRVKRKCSIVKGLYLLRSGRGGGTSWGRSRGPRL
jgi:hypothetical protein